jgi:putative heme transporter
MAETQAATPTSSRSRVIAALFSVGVTVFVIAALIIFLPRFVSYGDLWDVLKSLSWPELGALSVVAVVNLLTYGPSLVVALPGIRYRAALAATLAATASTTIAPGGPTVGLGISYLMLRAWGFSRSRITLALGLVTVWTQLITLSFPPIAFVLLWLSGESDPFLETLSVVGLLVMLSGIGIVFFVFRSASVAQTLGDAAASIATEALRIVRRPPVGWSGEQFARFRADAIALLRRRWHWLTLATYAGHLSVYLVLLVTLRAVGIGGDEVSIAESFAAWSIIRVLGGIPILPNGVGIVEVGLTTALVSFGGDEAKVVAAVLVYRFLSVVLPFIAGAIAGALWRRHHPGVVEQARATPATAAIPPAS